MICFNWFPVITVLFSRDHCTPATSLPAFEAAGTPHSLRADLSHRLRRSSCSAHDRRYGVLLLILPTRTLLNCCVRGNARIEQGFDRSPFTHLNRSLLRFASFFKSDVSLNGARI
jgi:hypothetical protein